MAKDTTGRTKQSKWPLFISLFIIASVFTSYFIIPDFHQFTNNAYEVLTSENEQMISSWVDNFGWWGPAMIILIMILQMFLLIIPSPLLMVVSILAYGQFWGAGLSIVAIFAASTVGYWIGRYLGIVTVDKLIGHQKEQKMEFYVERYGFWAIFITRLTPILSNDAISFVGGILKMGYWKFIGATIAGITPLTVMIAYFGNNNQQLITALIWVSAISLLLFIIYVIYDRKRNST